MANAKITFGKQSGGTLGLVFLDGVSNTEVIVPESGELVTKEYADTKQSKNELGYNVNTSSYIPNTLTSGAIIEIGSNTNGQYIKYTDGTLICLMFGQLLGEANATTNFTFPASFIGNNYTFSIGIMSQEGNHMNTYVLSGNYTTTNFQVVKSTAYQDSYASVIVIGRWK